MKKKLNKKYLTADCRYKTANIIFLYLVNYRSAVVDQL